MPPTPARDFENATHPASRCALRRDKPTLDWNFLPGVHSRRGAVVEGLVARAARRREMVRACARQLAAYRGP